MVWIFHTTPTGIHFSMPGYCVKMSAINTWTVFFFNIWPLRASFHCSIWGLLVLTGKFLVAHGIRDLVPWSSLGPLLWEHGVLAAGPPGKFLKYIYFTYPYSFSSVLPFFMEIHFLFSKELLTFLAKQIYWQQIPSVFCLSEGVCFSSTFEE